MEIIRENMDTAIQMFTMSDWTWHEWHDFFRATQTLYFSYSSEESWNQVYGWYYTDNASEDYNEDSGEGGCPYGYFSKAYRRNDYLYNFLCSEWARIFYGWE